MGDEKPKWLEGYVTHKWLHSSTGGILGVVAILYLSTLSELSGKADRDELANGLRDMRQSIEARLDTLTTLVLNDKDRQSQGQRQDVVVSTADNASLRQSKPGTLTPRQGAIEYGEALGYLTTRMYSVWSLEDISESQVRDRCARAEIPDAYKGRDGHWRIPWPRPDPKVAAN